MVSSSPATLKAICLATLTLQNAILALSMRRSRTRNVENMYIPSTVVVLTEIAKMLISVGFVYCMEANSVGHLLRILKNLIVKQPIDTLKVCIPAAAYVVQNNLLYVSTTHLDVATYQVTYQLKILTTAIFAVTMLRRKLGLRHWLGLALLVVGVAMVQCADTKERSVDVSKQNKTLGMAAALAACFLSGFAGIYFEMILKGADVSVWVRNVQLSVVSIPVGLVQCAANDWADISRRGFFTGHDCFVVYVIFLQAVGGLLVALVVKYADNILKGFATSLAIILSSVCGIFMFDLKLNRTYVGGAFLVICSIFVYSTATTPLAPKKHNNGALLNNNEDP